jgi:Crinkler effector protein N-terminal domain
MANDSVWIKLVIDGDESTCVFHVKITSETNFVDDLKKAVAKENQHKLTELSIDAPSLDVYLPGTTVFDPDGPDYLSPDLELSDDGFPKGTFYKKPLIVTAKSRQQQQQDTNVSLCRWQILS